MEYPCQWELSQLVADPQSESYKTTFTQYRTLLEAVAASSDQLPPCFGEAASGTAWGEFLKQFEQVETMAGDLHSGVSCYAAGDAGNATYQRAEAAIAALAPLRKKIYTNLEFALQPLSAEQLQTWIQSHPELKRVDYFLRTRQRSAALRLPKEQELLAADLGVDGLHAWGRFYDRISGVLRVQVMERGEVIEKSPGQVRMDLPDRAARENNFFAADKAWKSIEDDCADALNHIAGTRLTLYQRLDLQDHLVVPLFENRMQRKTLDAMWGAVSERKAMLSKYLERKARMLGVDRLAWWDTVAPLPGGAVASREIAYPQAVEEIVAAFSEFSQDLGEFARQAVRDRWVEAEDRSGKRQGGFCTGFPGAKVSRIFMTFTNTDDSMSTLAHELGHAYHSHILRDQPLFHQDYPMNLAETASTFAEAVLGGYRLRRTSGREERLQILDSMLSDAVVYLMNIHSRFLFEDRFYRERGTGEVGAETLFAMMEDAQRQAYVDGLSSWNGRFWASKLHFYISGLPFYNFPYTFGYLLSLGVFALARERGTAFADQYRELLLATGCQDTEDALRNSLGYDLTTGDFWHKSLDLVESRVEEYLEISA